MLARIFRIEIVDDASAAMYRHKTPAERLRILDELYVFSRKLTAAGIKQQFPNWTNAQVEQEVSRRIANAPD